MNLTRARWIAGLAAALLALTLALPATSATVEGSISLTSPSSGEAVARRAVVGWTFETGTILRSTSTVDILTSTNGVDWQTIAAGVWILAGGVTVDTSALPDNTYAIRAQVAGTSIASTVVPVYVDNTAPTVRIVSPAPHPAGSGFDTIILGRTALVANATDALSAVATVRWLVNNVEIGRGRRITYDFAYHPGKHTLTAIASDYAGNSAETSVGIIALAGPTSLTSFDPNRKPILPVATPSLSPGTVPDPHLPEPSIPPVPSPSPPGVPSPQPTSSPSIPPLP